MQKTVYECDACGKEIGATKHISLLTGNEYCGIAVPPQSLLKVKIGKPAPYVTIPKDFKRAEKGEGESDYHGLDRISLVPHWQVVCAINRKFLHFHNVKCMGSFFSKLMAAAK